MDSTDWESTLEAKKDGSLWSSFESSAVDDADAKTLEQLVSEEMEQNAWLDTLAQLSSEEVEFNMREADRADKARQMQEWGFDSVAIANTLDVATDTRLEDEGQVAGMQTYRNKVYEADYLQDLETIESHTRVDIDTNREPIRSQMVYVDEHTCIGCTNCAMIASNTFYATRLWPRSCLQSMGR
jgi:NAD-dependent dihydropyrimidine dehydrogenase PreA subunit